MPLPAHDQTQCSRDAGEWPGVRPRAPDRRPYVDHGQDGAHVGLALGVADVVPAEPDGVLGMPLVIEPWRCRTEVHEPERGRHRCSAPFHGNDRGRKSMPGPGPGAPVPRVRARSRTEVETRSARACSRGGCAGTSRTSSRGKFPGAGRPVCGPGGAAALPRGRVLPRRAAPSLADMGDPRHVVEGSCQVIRQQQGEPPQFVRDGIGHEAEPGQCGRHSDICGLCGIGPEGTGPGAGAGAGAGGPPGEGQD